MNHAVSPLTYPLHIYKNFQYYQSVLYLRMRSIIIPLFFCFQHVESRQNSNFLSLFEKRSSNAWWQVGPLISICNWRKKRTKMMHQLSQILSTSNMYLCFFFFLSCVNGFTEAVWFLFVWKWDCDDTSLIFGN